MAVKTTKPTSDLEARSRALQTGEQERALRDVETRVREYARAQRDRHVRAAGDLLETARSTGRPVETAKLETLVGLSESWEARMAALDARGRARAETARVTREPLTYCNRANPHNSWIADHRARARGDQAATERLERHGREMTVEMRARAGRMTEQRSRGDAIPSPASFERRAPNLNSAQGAEFMPPLWLIDLTATAPRPERVVADLVPSFPLPAGVSSISVPVITTGTVAQRQIPSAPAVSADLGSSATTSRVAVIGGFADVALQMLEQSGTAGAALDVIVWRDLLASYDAQLETQLIAGAGTAIAGPYAAGAQLLGVANVPGSGNITYTSGTPTATGIYPFLGQAFGTVTNTRKARPEAWIMRGGRWAWLATSEDAQGRPFGVPDAHNSPPDTPDDAPDAIGALVGVPAYTSEGIRSTLGAAGNQDQIIAFRPSDCLLWEGEPRLEVFEEVLSGSMGARVALWASAAFIAGRLPSGICTITGTGMAVQTNE